jgi:hypothetical protein
VQFSDFGQFDPRAYRNEYYSQIQGENLSLLKFFADAYEDMTESQSLLEFGGGPTVYQLISAAAKVGEIHFLDYLDRNLQEVRHWSSEQEGEFDWDPFIAEALKIEGVPSDTEAVTVRKQLMRKKIVAFLRGDAFYSDPAGPEHRGKYDIVSMNFVADSITGSRQEWAAIYNNVSSLIKPDGVLVTTALTGAEYWKLGDQVFPAVQIDETDMKRLLESLRFEVLILRTIESEEQDHTSPNFEGYTGMVFAKARLRR